MIDGEYKFLMLYSAIIASDTKGDLSYDKAYDLAKKAKDYLDKRRTIDSLLPEGVDFPLYKGAVCSFFDSYLQRVNGGLNLRMRGLNNESQLNGNPQSEPVYDKDLHHKIDAVFRKFNIRPTIGIRGLNDAVKLFLEQYAFNPEHCREVYDYMHEMKFIKI